jgi:hypothetical protein
MPTAGLPNSTEQPLVKSALIALRDVVNGNIDADNITNGSVATAELATGAVTLAKMAVNSVDSDQYVDGSIDTAHLAASSVTQPKIATATNSATGADIPYTGTEATIASIASVLPGLYLAIGTASNVALANIDSSGGTVTVNSTAMVENGSQTLSMVHGIIVVTATTTIRLRGVATSPPNDGVLTLFGFTS